MRITALVVAALICAGCAQASIEETQTVDSTRRALGEEPVAMRSILQEQYTGVRDPMRTVLKDGSALADFWRTAYATRGEAPELPSVNFNSEMVVVAALGSRSSGGYTVHLDSARINSGVLEIIVRSVSPGPTCGTTGAITDPVAAAAMPRSQLPVRFIEQHETHSC
jgi:hypothetical protein